MSKVSVSKWRLSAPYEMLKELWTQRSTSLKLFACVVHGPSNRTLEFQDAPGSPLVFAMLVEETLVPLASSWATCG